MKNGAQSDELEHWWRIAQAALNAENAGALDALVTASGLHKTTLRRFAHAARRIPPIERAQLSSWRDEKGRPLTPWIVTALARLTPAKRAGVLADMRSQTRSLVKVRALTRFTKCRGTLS